MCNICAVTGGLKNTHPFFVAKPAKCEVEGRSGFQLESWTQCVSWTWRFGMTPLDPWREGELYTSSKTNMDTYNIDEDVTASSGNLLNCWVGLQLAAIPSFQNTFSTFLIWPRRAKSTRIYRKPRPIAVQIHVSEIQPTTYCWWKKSQTTTWDVWHPVNSGIFTISTG